MNWYQTIYNHYYLIDIKIGQILLALRDDIATLVKANCEWWSLIYSKTFDNNMIFHENWPCKIYRLSLYKILQLLRHSQKKEQIWKCMSWYQSVFDHYYWIDMKIGQILLAYSDHLATLVKANCKSWRSLIYSKTFDNNTVLTVNSSCLSFLTLVWNIPVNQGTS